MQRERYPTDWEKISLARREAAGWKCEWCGRPNGAVLSVAPGGWWYDAVSDVWRGPHGRETQIEPDEDPRVTRVVLTVAHLGTARRDGRPGDKHDKMDVRPENLAALCASCHLSYDHADHVANARCTRRLRHERLNPALPGLTEANR